jgi:hypothetical protein
MPTLLGGVLASYGEFPEVIQPDWEKCVLDVSAKTELMLSVVLFRSFLHFLILGEKLPGYFDSWFSFRNSGTILSQRPTSREEYGHSSKSGEATSS